jgi:ligand-binding sensor domain-containing protein
VRVRLARLVIVLLFAPWLLHGRRLPIKTYTTADGLARDHILCILQDSHGFLWICTAEGLSRFDGYSFTNYHVEQGLPSNTVTDFLETREGTYWIATTGGLCRFEPTAAPARFTCFPRDQTNFIGALYQDPGGVIWAGGQGSLLRINPSTNTTQPSGISIPLTDTVTSLISDRQGSLWIGTSNGLYRHQKDGSTGELADFRGEFIMAMLVDHEGRLWLGTRTRLVRFDIDGSRRVFTMKDGLPAVRIESLLETRDHTLWVGTTQGLVEWVPSAGQMQTYSLAQGLSAHAVGPLEEDRVGNLWIGTFGSGLMKIARSGFSTYNEGDGVPFADAFARGGKGETIVLSRGDHPTVLNRFDGTTFTAIHPNWPGHLTDFGWGRGQLGFQSAKDNHWWLATGQGLYVFPGLRASPSRVFAKRDGLPGNNIFRVFEDSRGDVWIGTIGPNPEDGLARWSRASNTLHAFTEAEGFPHSPVPTGIAEDHNGAMWFTFFHGGLARLQSAKLTFFDNSRIPGFLFTVFCDSKGRLWIGSSRGLIRLDDPSQDRFVTYRTADGLASNSVEAITEDRQGRIYAATGRGADRFEPTSTGLGHIKHYTTADGLAPGELNLAFTDSSGGLWFGTALGVSRFLPAKDPPRPPPPVLLTGVTVGGLAQSISDLGQPSVSGLRIQPAPIRIDFVGLDYSPGETLRYQYMLEGGDRDWGPATDQRSVVYANLASGGYRFLVRAVSSDGATSAQPAVMAFTVLPPLWRTWWFLGLCALAAAGIGLALHRYRLAQLLAVANIRTRIATDLHDDIGASLSQIAVLSEVALRTNNEPDTTGTTPLHEIAGISRELIDGMSDIVWAINPEHDFLSNLIYRMRRIATDLLGGKQIALQFRPSVADQDLKIGADVRRHVYLIFKEAIHNIARHSGATAVDVALDLVSDTLNLTVSDNGKGFDPEGEFEGRGLANIRKRAAAIGGSVEWRTNPGCRLTLLVPL